MGKCLKKHNFATKLVMSEWLAKGGYYLLLCEQLSPKLAI